MIIRSSERARWPVFLTVTLVLALLSCAKKSSPAGVDPRDEAPVIPPLSARPRTTSWSIAGDNLNADIAGRLRRDEPDGPSRLALVELVLARGQFVSNVVDYELADALAAKAVRAFPKNPEAHLAQALAHAALHRFEAGLRELDQAKAFGAPSEHVEAARAATFLATGHYDEADKLLPPESPSSRPEELVTRAVLLGHMQKFEDAERLFERARTSIVDVSPFPVAWMDFQRATLLEAHDKTLQARRYFEEAADAIPVYAHAVVHLASIDAPSVARGRLEALRDSRDPDVLAALADAYRREKRDADAARVAVEARERYKELVAKHPEAYSDHAARFYLGAGSDPKVACELAEKNAKLRPTEEAIDLWMAAAAALGDNAQICASARAMSRLVYISTLRSRLAAATLKKNMSACPAAP